MITYIYMYQRTGCIRHAAGHRTGHRAQDTPQDILKGHKSCPGPYRPIHHTLWATRHAPCPSPCPQTIPAEARAQTITSPQGSTLRSRKGVSKRI